MNLTDSSGIPAVTMEDVTFRYAPYQEEVLSRVTLEIPCGESCCVIGPNGGGKSTLLKLILGLLVPESGRIRVFGRPPREGALQIGYMPQHRTLDGSFPVSVIEVVLAGTLRGTLLGGYSTAAKKAAMGALDEVGLAGLARKSFAELSGGQQQRVLIARALAGGPRLMLLDEPTSNVDPAAEEEFYQLLNRLRDHLTVVTVSHDLGFVRAETGGVLCVNRTVTRHLAGDVTPERAAELYHHQVRQVHHCRCCGQGVEQ